MHSLFKISFLLSGLPLLVTNRVVAQSNTPTTQTQVPAPTVSLYSAPSYSGFTLANYVRIWDAQQPYTTEAALLGVTTTGVVHKTTQYVDGLGRPIEAVSWQMSGT